MFVNLIDALELDCKTLLDRALVGNTVNAFGIDGNGQYGAYDMGLQYKVNGVTFHLDADVTEDLIASGLPIFGRAAIFLDGYTSFHHGHICTDQNLKISLNALLAAAHIDTNCWDWGSIERQGIDYVVLKIEVNRLVEW